MLEQFPVLAYVISFAGKSEFTTPKMSITKTARVRRAGDDMGDDGMSQSPSPDKESKDWCASLPFPAHWLWYIAAKLLVLALVAGFVLYWYGLI